MVDTSMTSPAVQSLLKILLACAIGLGLYVISRWMSSRIGKDHALTKATGLGAVGIPGIAIVVIALGAIGLIPTLGPIGAAAVGGPSAPIIVQITQQDQVDLIGCGTGDKSVTPRPIFTLLNEYTQGSLTEGTNAYRTTITASGQAVKGAWTTLTSGTAVSADIAAGTTIEVVYGVTTTDFVGNAYGPFKQYTIGCEESEEFYAMGANDENAAGLESTFLNRRKAAAAESSPSVSSQHKFFVEFRAGSREVYGNPYGTDSEGNTITMPNELVLDLNTTMWDTIDEAWIEQSPPSCNCDSEVLPMMPTNKNHTRVLGGTNLTQSWAMYPIANNQDWIIGFHATRSSSTLTFTDGNDNVHLYSGNYYIFDANAPSDTANTVGFGRETRLNALVGQTAPETLQLDFT